MSDLRKDPLLDQWVIVAANRAQRPGALIESPPFEPGLPCPFCEGHEHETPPELLAFRPAASAADGPQWRVRVVPNKFPALEPGSGTEESLPSPACRRAPCTHGRQDGRGAGGEGGSRSEAGSDDAGLYQRRAARGAHEVIVESPRHVVSTSDLSIAELREVLLAQQMRLAYWKRDPRMAYGQIFKNVGQAAGASQEHIHSQLLVIPEVPRVIAAEMSGRWTISASGASARFATWSVRS